MPFLNRVWFSMVVALRNMGRHPRRTGFSLLSIAMAMTAMIVFQSWVAGIESSFRVNVITAGIGHFQIFKKGFRTQGQQDPFAYQIEDTAGLRKAIEAEVGPLAMLSRRQQFYSFLNTDDHSIGAVGQGVDAAEERRFLTLIKVKEGQHLADAGPLSAFVGYKLATQLNLKVGDYVTIMLNTKTGSLNAQEVKVVGTFDSGVEQLDSQQFYVHLALAQKLLHVTGVPQLVLGLKDDNDVPLIKPLTKMLAAKFPDLELVHWPALAEYFDNTMGWLDAQHQVSRVIILVIAGLSIANVFLITLFERLGEFGTLRALGTYRWEIAGMVFIEAIMQALVGTLAGTGFGILLLRLVLKKGVTMPPPMLMNTPFHVALNVPWHSMIGLSCACAVVASLSGLIPALKMSRANIVEALSRNI